MTPGVPAPPGVTPRLGFRRDIDYFDIFSIAHFCIPAYLSAKGGPKAALPLTVAIIAFEYYEPKLRKIDKSLYFETPENVTGDIIAGVVGILIGGLLFFVEFRVGQRRKSGEPQ